MTPKEDGTQALRDFERAEQARETVRNWLASFESALHARDADAIASLFQSDSHWRDVLTFTWNYSSARGSNAIATRLAAAQQETAAHGFHLPHKRMPPRHVKRLGVASIEALFEFLSLIHI